MGNSLKELSSTGAGVLRELYEGFVPATMRRERVIALGTAAWRAAGHRSGLVRPDEGAVEFAFYVFRQRIDIEALTRQESPRILDAFVNEGETALTGLHTRYR